MKVTEYNFIGILKFSKKASFLFKINNQYLFLRKYKKLMVGLREDSKKVFEK